MRRSVITAKEPNDSVIESFSGVFEQMTRGDQVRLSNEMAGAVAAKRLPVEPLPDTRSRLAAEAVSLSYEQALKRHSRRRISEEITFPEIASPSRKTESLKYPSHSIEGRAPAARMDTQAQSQAAHSRKSKATNLAAREIQGSGKTRRLSSEQSSQAAASSDRRLRAANPKDVAQSISKVRSKPSGKPVSEAKPPAPELSNAAEKALKLRKAFFSDRNRNEIKTSTYRKRLQPEPVSNAIVRASPAPLISSPHLSFNSEASAIEQRRTVVSIRLSEEESLRLKLRAAESGISVSAYMRSCVLDAEHLRTQVKQALSQMRASAQQPEPLAAMQLAARSETAFGTAWLRVVTRTAALFLAPLFSFRHRG